MEALVAGLHRLGLVGVAGCVVLLCVGLLSQQPLSGQVLFALGVYALPSTAAVFVLEFLAVAVHYVMVWWRTRV